MPRTGVLVCPETVRQFFFTTWSRMGVQSVFPWPFPFEIRFVQKVTAIASSLGMIMGGLMLRPRSRALPKKCFGERSKWKRAAECPKRIKVPFLATGVLSLRHDACPELLVSENVGRLSNADANLPPCPIFGDRLYVVTLCCRRYR